MRPLSPSVQYIMLHCVSLCYIHCVTLCNTVLHCATLCFTVSHCVTYTVLHYVTLCYLSMQPLSPSVQNTVLQRLLLPKCIAAVQCTVCTLMYWSALWSSFKRAYHNDVWLAGNTALAYGGLQGRLSSLVVHITAMSTREWMKTSMHMRKPYVLIQALNSSVESI